MLQSIYKYLIGFREVGGDMVDRIHACNAGHVFDELIREYPDREKLNKALFFILLAYSKESKAIHHDVSWSENKSAIAYSTGVSTDKELYADLMNLRTSAIANTIKKYLDYQGSEVWSHLMMLKDLYEQMRSSAMGIIKDHNGFINYDQKYKNAGYAKELSLQVREWEQRLSDEENTSKGAREEVVRVTKQSERYTLRLEDVLNQVQKEVEQESET